MYYLILSCIIVDTCISYVLPMYYRSVDIRGKYMYQLRINHELSSILNKTLIHC